MMPIRQDVNIAQSTKVISPNADAKMVKGEETLQAKVWSPFRVYFNDEAKSVSAVNGTGPFDVLPHHHNFITLLNSCDLALATKDGDIKIKISGGVMHVHQNVVTVFLDV
jgi:F0F1-type ATP synthase epsilon subunit